MLPDPFCLKWMQQWNNLYNLLRPYYELTKKVFFSLCCLNISKATFCRYTFLICDLQQGLSLSPTRLSAEFHPDGLCWVLLNPAMIKRDCPLSLCLYFVAVLCPVSLFFYLVRICSVRVRLPPFHLPSFPRVKNTNEGHPRVLTHFYSSLHSTGLPGGQPGVNAAKTKSLFFVQNVCLIEGSVKVEFLSWIFQNSKEFQRNLLCISPSATFP